MRLTKVERKKDALARVWKKIMPYDVGPLGFTMVPYSQRTKKEWTQGSFQGVANDLLTLFPELDVSETVLVMSCYGILRVVNSIPSHDHAGRQYIRSVMPYIHELDDLMYAKDNLASIFLDKYAHGFYFPLDYILDHGTEESEQYMSKMWFIIIKLMVLEIKRVHPEAIVITEKQLQWVDTEYARVKDLREKRSLGSKIKEYVENNSIYAWLQ